MGCSPSLSSVAAEEAEISLSEVDRLNPDDDRARTLNVDLGTEKAERHQTRWVSTQQMRGCAPHR